ncbi:hypothetical protein [Dyadobacter psychrotolerans]|uniref:Uncharacterized protein n=1 Tax=Dyadobacter psychrotolerans TaxID=2541721 RepID=A0A4R5D7R5_9BACT|nr:hypothetical protein [Dyadobacter psychrotolerans]TDE09559.1 hypothetical protein E0F88_30185 [Dyadobacter psychrotolerans]
MEKNWLEPLDLIVNTTLNPQTSEVYMLRQEHVEQILKNVNQEKNKQIYSLKNQIFNLSNHLETQISIGQYHSHLIKILDKCLENSAKVESGYVVFHLACRAVIGCLKDILSFLEMHFEQYLISYQHLPAAYFNEFKTELLQRVEQIKSYLLLRNPDSELNDILFETVYGLLCESQIVSVTYRQALYLKILVTEIEKLNEIQANSKFTGELIPLLFHLNFNSPEFTDYYKCEITEQLSTYRRATEQIEYLLNCYKVFNQIPLKPGAALNPHLDDIQKTVNIWFAQQIASLEKQLQCQINPVAASQNLSNSANTESFKVMCFLSIDQIALVIRALDSLRIIQSRSLNMVFKSITPFLSTPRKADLSWKSVRTKAYNYEESDKTTVINMLEKIIVWVKES